MERRKRRRAHNHVSIDYYAYISGLRGWNAVFKAVFAVSALTAVIAADSAALSILTVLYMGILTCIPGRVRWQDYLRLLLLPFAFVILSGAAVLLQFGSGEESIFCIRFLSAYLYITEDSLQQAIGLSLKAMGGVSCLYLLTLSTPMGEIIGVFRRLHVPGLILELMHFIYRYIFILLEINQRQKDAVKSRLGYCDCKKALRVFGNEMGNLLVMSMSRAQNYYDALESRGYEGSCLFWEEKKRMEPVQLLWGFVYAAAASVVLFVL